ncbi:MAG TPA: HDOD domain-containing protein [Solirubrobacteraceae bacterium]|jgi:putative nucleotidyltransferase with HDIG domain
MQVTASKQGATAANGSPRPTAVPDGIKAPAAAAAGSSRHPEGHGRRLTTAFEALEHFPALVESRDRLLTVASKDNVVSSEVVTTVESDVALMVAVLRLAGRDHSGRSRIDTIPSAIERLSPDSVGALARRARTFDFFERSSAWEAVPERFRLHALGTQHAADRIAGEIGYEHRDRLTVTSLLHDIGKLVLIHAYPGYPGQIHQDAQTPEARVRQERRELGIDHALVGGVLARRWGLAPTIAKVIERHHNDDAGEESVIVRLADMLAHYAQGDAVSPAEMLRGARTLGLTPRDLRRVLYELPGSSNQRQRHVDPCPLSNRELSVLQRLADGKVYKQIAHELTLSTSTVRTHLHNIYGKLGAVDRAQAVLIATERGWL